MKKSTKKLLKDVCCKIYEGKEISFNPPLHTYRIKIYEIIPRNEKNLFMVKTVRETIGEEKSRTYAEEISREDLLYFDGDYYLTVNGIIHLLSSLVIAGITIQTSPLD